MNQSQDEISFRAKVIQNGNDYVIIILDDIMQNSNLHEEDKVEVVVQSTESGRD